ncbi:tetratricopeptide repeat protein [Streptomyces sp. NRRL WC-3774]|nr:MULTISPECIES: tetratricopeptide repeat protein [Streptomyces]
MKGARGGSAFGEVPESEGSFGPLVVTGQPMYLRAAHVDLPAENPDPTVLPTITLLGRGWGPGSDPGELPLPPGQLLAGQYRLIRPLGYGGMGEVYLALDTKVDHREVAIKMLHPDQAAAAAGALARERRALVDLGHDDIIRVFNYGHHPEVGDFLVLQYVDGLTLEEVRARAQLNPGEFGDQRFHEFVLAYGVRILSALAYLHADRPGKVYGDLKPDNVMHDGTTTKIIDVGSVRPAGAPGMTTTGFSAPTVGPYGESRPQDDLFSLGETLRRLSGLGTSAQDLARLGEVGTLREEPGGPIGADADADAARAAGVAAGTAPTTGEARLAADAVAAGETPATRNARVAEEAFGGGARSGVPRGTAAEGALSGGEASAVPAQGAAARRGGGEATPGAGAAAGADQRPGAGEAPGVEADSSGGKTGVVQRPSGVGPSGAGLGRSGREQLSAAESSDVARGSGGEGASGGEGVVSAGEPGAAEGSGGAVVPGGGLGVGGAEFPGVGQGAGGRGALSGASGGEGVVSAGESGAAHGSGGGVVPGPEGKKASADVVPGPAGGKAPRAQAARHVGKSAGVAHAAVPGGPGTHGEPRPSGAAEAGGAGHGPDAGEVSRGGRAVAVEGVPEVREGAGSGSGGPVAGGEVMAKEPWGPGDATAPVPRGLGLLSLARVLHRATLSDPAGRFADAREMEQQLRGVFRELRSLRTGAETFEPSPLFHQSAYALDGALGSAPPLAHWTAPDAPSPFVPPSPAEVARRLPVPRPDPHDEHHAELSRLADAAPEALLQHIGDWQDSTEVHLLRCRLRLRNPADEPDAAERELRAAEARIGPARAPYDWRLDWHRGLLALARDQVPSAWRHFDRVYAAIPGEYAPKLALGHCAERLGRPHEALTFYEAVRLRNPSLGSAAFGAARARLALDGERAREEAVRELDAVPQHSRHRTAARTAAVRIGIEYVRRAGHDDELPQRLREVLGRLALLFHAHGLTDEEARVRMTVEVWEAVQGALTRGALDAADLAALSAGADPRLGLPPDEHGLREDLSRRYVTLAHQAARSAAPEDAAVAEILLDRAYEVRPLAFRHHRDSPWLGKRVADWLRTVARAPSHRTHSASRGPSPP